MNKKRRATVGKQKALVGDGSDRVPETDVEALAREIEGLSTTGPVDQASGSKEERQDSFTEGHVLAWYIKRQIQTSPLTPTEIAERAGVSISQIYRFLKGERSLTLESADKILQVVGRSLVDAILRQQGEMTVDRGVEGQIEDEKERLRRRLDEWERGTYQGVSKIQEDVNELAARIRKVIDDL
jgi:transcriptional regulator with XRE-family HTH domain